MFSSALSSRARRLSSSGPRTTVDPAAMPDRQRDEHGDEAEDVLAEADHRCHHPILARIHNHRLRNHSLIGSLTATTSTSDDSIAATNSAMSRPLTTGR